MAKGHRKNVSRGGVASASGASKRDGKRASSRVRAAKPLEPSAASSLCAPLTSLPPPSRARLVSPPASPARARRFLGRRRGAPRAAPRPGPSRARGGRRRQLLLPRHVRPALGFGAASRGAPRAGRGVHARQPRRVRALPRGRREVGRVRRAHGGGRDVGGERRAPGRQPGVHGERVRAPGRAAEMGDSKLRRRQVVPRRVRGRRPLQQRAPRARGFRGGVLGRNAPGRAVIPRGLPGGASARGAVGGGGARTSAAAVAAAESVRRAEAKGKRS